MSRNDASRYAAQRRVSLLVRNLPLDTRAEDLRAKFERFGEVRDVYLPRDYYTQRPRGFGFIEFRDTRDAEEALYQLDRSMMGGREITVVLSKEDRKSPREMLKRDDEYPPARGTSSGSRRRRSRSGDRRKRSPRRRSASRERSYSRGRSFSRSPSRSAGRAPRSPAKGRSPSPADRVIDPPRERYPENDRERSRSPVRREEYSD